jgi:type IV secretory pathway TraG/TraD family ATPase VirD4
VPCGILINLAAKISLSISERDSNYRIYYYIDEMPVLPNNISLFQPLCAFGRSQGIRVIIGIQGEAQLEQTYGKETAAAILTCFTNNIILKTNDHLSLEALTKRFGKTHKAITSMGMTRNSVNTSMVETTAIEPDVLNSLDVGEAIVSILGHEPFWIKLDQNI